MSEITQHLDVVVIDSGEGTVHVRSSQNLEEELARNYSNITSSVGDTALDGAIDIVVPPIRTGKSPQERDKQYVSWRGEAEKPTKLKK